MKKYMITYFILLLLLCFLCGCSSNNLESETESQSEWKDSGNVPSVDTEAENQIEAQQTTEDVYPEDQISMRTAADASGNLTITITNDSNAAISTGHRYQLQKQEGTDWTEVPVEAAFTDEAIAIYAGESYEFQETIDVASLEKGTAYRIVKSVYADQTEYELTAVIELE